MYIYTRISVCIYIYIYHDATWAYVCFKLRTPTCFFFRDIGIATGFCWAEHGPHEVRGALAELRCATTPQWAYPKLPKLCRQVLDLCSICVGMAATFTMNDVDVFWNMADFPASHSNSFLGCHDQGIWEKEKGGHPQAVQNLLLVLCFHKLAALDIYLFKYEMGNDNERLIEGWALVKYQLKVFVAGWFIQHVLLLIHPQCIFVLVQLSWLSFWSNYVDLTRPHPKWWFSKRNPLVSGKPMLVKYYTLAR